MSSGTVFSLPAIWSACEAIGERRRYSARNLKMFWVMMELELFLFHQLTLDVLSHRDRKTGCGGNLDGSLS